ncbi:hypothetical protein BYT27DRAFT_7193492, partial [Phlegmacium glaucopus]
MFKGAQTSYKSLQATSASQTSYKSSSGPSSTSLPLTTFKRAQTSYKCSSGPLFNLSSIHHVQTSPDKLQELVWALFHLSTICNVPIRATSARLGPFLTSFPSTTFKQAQTSYKHSSGPLLDLSSIHHIQMSPDELQELTSYKHLSGPLFDLSSIHHLQT